MDRKYIDFHIKENVTYNNLLINGSTVTTNRSDIGNIGMVSSAKYEASQIGSKIIKNGGNTFDAAVATGFALSVCEPNASGLGGGGLMTAKKGITNEYIFVDFREIAPGNAYDGMWKTDSKGKALYAEKSEGGKSVCIPGEVAGLCYILAKYGTMTIKEVLKPVIDLAQNGIIVSAQLKNDLDENREKMNEFYESGNVYVEKYEIGDKLINEALIKTLEIISLKGEDSFYRGELTNRMIDSINFFGGNVSYEDFSNYRVNEINPLMGSYRGFEIISSPPPSSGGTHIIEILNILEEFNLSSMGLNSLEHIHLLSETFKTCFADRAKYMGDSKFTKIPIKGLISKEYAKEKTKEIKKDRVNKYDYGNPFLYEPTDTTHYSIADNKGNLVSISKTISSFFGSGIVPKNTGIILNCQMRGFADKSGQTNSVSGYKKPLSSMSPSIVLKDNEPFALLGSPGGNRIITSVSQVISNLIDFDMDIESAINSPRIHNECDGILHYESRIENKIIKELERMGQITNSLGKWDRYVGGVQGIRILGNKTFIGAADPRREGKAIGC